MVFVQDGGKVCVGNHCSVETCKTTEGDLNYLNEIKGFFDHTCIYIYMN